MKKNFILSLLLLVTVFSGFAAPPTVPSSNLAFPVASLDGNRFTMSFNKGNGAFRIIVVKAGSPVTGLPVNGTEYTANAAYGTAGTEFAPGDGYVVFRGRLRAATPLLGTVNVLSRETWDAAGGWLPGFRGWGHEDLAFAAQCRTLVSPERRVPGPLHHLYHPKAPTEPYAAPETIAANAAIATDIYAADGNPTRMRELIRAS